MARPGNFFCNSKARGKKALHFKSASHHLFIILTVHDRWSPPSWSSPSWSSPTRSWWWWLSPCRATVASHSVTLSSWPSFSFVSRSVSRLIYWRGILMYYGIHIFTCPSSSIPSYVSGVKGDVYDSLSDVPESRVWFASKKLTPCRMHWNDFLICKIVAECQSFPNMYDML